MSLTTLNSFWDTSADGAQPYGRPVQSADGSLYGTTKFGGAFSAGTIFRIDAAGTQTTVHSFGAIHEGVNPHGSVIQTSDGSLVGSASVGGTSGSGVVFRRDSAGTLTTLHSFSGPDGYTPHDGVNQTSDGGFVGTTFSGGSAYQGTVFRLDSNGALSVAHSFTGAQWGPTRCRADPGE